MRRLASIILAAAICCLLLNTALFTISVSLPPSLRGQAQSEKPFYFVDDCTYWGAITDIAVCENYLYILYDSKMVMACYDLDGNYICSYSFDMINKGKAQLHITRETLYVESSGHDFYSFSSARFTDYYENGNDTIHIAQDFLPDYQKSGAYELRGASIWKITEDGAEEVVHRPPWMALLKDHAQIVIHIICIIFISGTAIFRRKTAC